MIGTVRVLLALVILTTAIRADEPEPGKKKLSKEDIVKAQKTVVAYLEKIKGNYGQTANIVNEAVERALPGHAFFLVLYRQYPVGRVPPTGLKSSNVFVVGPDGKAMALTTAKELEAYFKKALPATSSEAKLKDAARAWVGLSQQLVQDGFYQFKLEDDSTKIEGKDAKTARAKVVVMKGGNGTLTAALKFDKTGKLTSVEETAKIRPGPRPICQATKLLDKDPIVRAMAEQALLCMGRPAKGYLDEQKAKASPELKTAIERIWQKIVASEE